MITFSDYVYSIEEPYYAIPTIVLQTAVNIRNADTNQLERFTQIVPLPGQNSQTMPAMAMHEDIQLEITSTYNPVGTLTAVSVLDQDALNRAGYYLAGLSAQYNQSAAQTLNYNGILPIDLDGAIMQVTWEVGPEGATTFASVNTEHHLYVPPYPARRRAEFLPAVLPQQLGIEHGAAALDRRPHRQTRSALMQRNGGDKTGLPLRPITWWRICNADTEVIPPFGIVYVTGTNADGSVNVTLPITDSQTDVLFNGSGQVGVGRYGQANTSFPCIVAYNQDPQTGDIPGNGNVWGGAGWELVSGEGWERVPRGGGWWG